MSILETIFSPLAGLVGTGLGIYSAKQNRDYNERMWDKNNEYNSMSAQVQRALDAGVNPNALFSNGYTPAQSSPLSVTPDTNPAIATSNLIGSLTQSVLAFAQAENLSTQSDLNKYELTWNKMTENERYEALMNMNSKTKAEIAKLFSDIGVNDFNKDLQEKTFRWFATKTEAELQVMSEQLNLLRNQSLDILKGIDLKSAQIKDLFSSISLKQAQRDKTNSDIAVNASLINESISRTNLLGKQIDYTDEQTKLVKEQKEGQKISNDIEQIALNFSDLTGIPLGTSESEALFALWVNGNWTALNERIAINSANTHTGGKAQDIKNIANSTSYGVKSGLSDSDRKGVVYTK